MLDADRDYSDGIRDSVPARSRRGTPLTEALCRRWRGFGAACALFFLSKCKLEAHSGFGTAALGKVASIWFWLIPLCCLLALH